MIYGLNFNGTQIPSNVGRVFAGRLNAEFNRVTPNRTATWLLQGVCNTKEECERMALQADNGNRRFFLVHRFIKREKWIGFYIGWK